MSTPIFTRDQIVAEARKCIGTRWHHQGRKVGVGLDCVGLLVVVARALKLPHEDSRAYPRTPNTDRPEASKFTLMRTLLAACDELPSVDDARDGSVLVFEFLGPKWPQHVAIKTPKGILHAACNLRRVVEHGYDEWWRSRAVHALDFRGVA